MHIQLVEGSVQIQMREMEFDAGNSLNAKQLDALHRLACALRDSTLVDLASGYVDCVRIGRLLKS